MFTRTSGRGSSWSGSSLLFAGLLIGSLPVSARQACAQATVDPPNASLKNFDGSAITATPDGQFTIELPNTGTRVAVGFKKTLKLPQADTSPSQKGSSADQPARIAIGLVQEAKKGATDRDKSTVTAAATIKYADDDKTARLPVTSVIDVETATGTTPPSGGSIVPPPDTARGTATLAPPRPGSNDPIVEVTSLVQSQAGAPTPSKPDQSTPAPAAQGSTVPGRSVVTIVGPHDTVQFDTESGQYVWLDRDTGKIVGQGTGKVTWTADHSLVTITDDRQHFRASADIDKSGAGTTGRAESGRKNGLPTERMDGTAEIAPVPPSVPPTSSGSSATAPPVQPGIYRFTAPDGQRLDIDGASGDYVVYPAEGAPSLGKADVHRDSAGSTLSFADTRSDLTATIDMHSCIGKADVSDEEMARACGIGSPPIPPLRKGLTDAQLLVVDGLQITFKMNAPILPMGSAPVPADHAPKYWSDFIDKGQAPGEPFVALVATGQSQGDAIEVQVFDPKGAPMTVTAPAGLVLQPMDTGQATSAADRATPLAGTHVTQGFCLQIHNPPPARGMLYRIADESLQQKYRPVASVLRAADRLTSSGQLHPDVDPRTYAESITQWAVWTKVSGWSEKAFTDEFVNYTRRNMAAANRPWTKQADDVVRKAAPNRWNDIQSILAEASAGKNGR